jgi:DNA ligase-1
MFPEIVEAAMSINMNSFILDSEILGWNYEKDTFMTYQETMQRRRKYDVSKLSDSIPVKAMVFDILYRNGQNLLEIDTVDRVELLNKEIGDTDGGISLALTEQVSDLDVLNSIFDNYVEKGLEGIIVKMKKGGYNPGSRDYEWIKLKKSMKKGLVDTFDLVVVGYFKGSGRRSDFGLGALLGAVYDDEKDTFETVCKVGTGLGDELLKDMSNILKEIEIKEVEKRVVCDKGLEADVWVVPKYVITVEADEVSRNIGKGNGLVAGGLSLRFPRLIEFGRDKGPYDATTLKELVSIYNKQKNIVKNA